MNRVFRILIAFYTAIHIGFHANPSAASEADRIAATVTESLQSYITGDIKQAVQILEDVLLASHDSSELLEYRSALVTLLDICEEFKDSQCILNYSKILSESPIPDVGKDLFERQNAYYYILNTLHVANFEEWAKQLPKDGSLSRVMLFSAPFYYIRTNILEAEIYIKQKKIAKARQAIDRALALLLSLNNPDPYFVSNRLREIFLLLMATGDVDRAYKLFLISLPLTESALSGSVPDLLLFSMAAGELLYYTDRLDVALQAYRQALDLAKRLKVNEDYQDRLLGHILINIAGLCIISGDSACAAEAVEQHPQASQHDAFIVSGRFQNYPAYIYACARAIISSLVNSSVPDAWLAALASPPEGSWSEEEHELLTSYGQFAIGISHLSRQNKEQASRHLLAASLSRTAFIQSRYQSFGYGLRLPDAIDRLIVQGGILAFTINPELVETNSDLLLSLFEINNKTSRDIDADTLAELVSSNSRDVKRIIHANRRLTSRQHYVERQLLKKLVDLIGSDVPKAVNKQIFDTYKMGHLADYGKKRGVVLSALSEHYEKHPRQLPNLNNLKSSLQPNESFASVSRALGKVVYLCVRNDRIMVRQADVDLQRLVTNTKLVMNGLTATHPPSDLLDSQYPVEAAMFLYEALLQPLEDCLYKGDHIIWSPHPSYLNFPITSLLSIAPPRTETGYDLKKAKWFGLDYSISHVTSAQGFIAARQLSASIYTPYAFLGIGDPILTGDTEDGVPRITVASTRSATTRNGRLKDLWELPETSLELNLIKKSAGRTGKVLTRGEATELNFRRQLLDHYKTINFATHGLIREEVAGLNEAALVLTPESASSALNDGLLTASEIANLNLNARLAVLSACNTANFDPVLFGNEVQGLTTAFALAGTPATLATLWPVDSQSTTKIIVALFEELFSNRHLSPASDLQQAIKRFLQNPPSTAHYHPRFWSPFVLFGDGGQPLYTETKPANKFEIQSHYLGSFLGGGEVTGVYFDQQRNSVYVSGYGDLKDERFHSFLAQISDDAKPRWIYKDYEISMPTIVTSDDDGLLAVGYLLDEDEKSIPILYRVNHDGQKVWQRELDIGTGDGFPAASYANSDNSFTLIIHVDPNHDHLPPQELHLLRLSPEGMVIQRNTISLPPTVDWEFPRVSIIDDKAYIYQKGLPQEYDVMYKDENGRLVLDEYGLPKICLPSPMTLLYSIDRTTLTVQDQSAYNRIDLKAVSRVSPVRVVGAANLHTPCSLETKAALLELIPDSQYKPLHIEDAPFNSKATALLNTEDGRLLLVGVSTRPYNIESRAPIDIFDTEKFLENNERSIRELGLYESQDTFLTEMDIDGAVLSRSWFGTGSKLYYHAGAIVGDNIFLGGNADWQVMWSKIEETQ